MHKLDENADSVNFLITALCDSLLREENQQLEAAVADVQKLKARAFAILLKKSTRAHYPAADQEAAFEPQRALDKQIFTAKLHAQGNPQECAKFAAFEEHLEQLWEDSYFTEGTGREVLQLLLALQGNVCDEVSSGPRKPELLVPGPFTLHANYQWNRHYPKQLTENLQNPQPRYFQGLQPVKSHDNPYLPKFLFTGEDNKLARIQQEYAGGDEDEGYAHKRKPRDDCSFTGLARRLWGSSMRINVQPFRLFADCANSAQLQLQQRESATSTAVAVAETAPAAPPVVEEPRVFAWNWESLGSFGIACAKPFASDTNVTLDLQSHLDRTNGRAFEAKILTQKQFLQDLKSLIVGIQSDTFQHDEYIVFTMLPHITVEGVLPATIESYTVDFLECGTCYKRLQTMIMKRDYKLMFEGFMFKALCSAVDEFLLTFRQFVFALHDQHMMSFHRRMKKMFQQITNLSYTLAIHPNVDATVKPPMGSQFLGYLYREIMRLTEMDYITLLVFILKRCCHVYFKHLQKWIFYGLLDDPSNELFIGFVDHYRQNTKYYYDKAYFVRKESVPGFFQNYEEQILQCGKYTMLLKAYKPNHPLFDLEYPSISVCLSFEEIQKLEANCSKYYERAREHCGKPITIRKVFETRAEQKRHFFQVVSQRWRANMAQWSLEQHELALIVAEQKKRRLEELSTQLEDAKQRKIAERRANVEHELKLLRETEKLEEQRLLREDINLRKRIEYYQELSDIMQQDAHEESVRLLQKQQLTQAPTLSVLNVLSGRAVLQPTTPASTDFESCDGDGDGDEDAESVYGECISDDFMIKFAESELELAALCAQQVNNNLQLAELSSSQKESQQVEHKEQQEGTKEAPSVEILMAGLSVTGEAVGGSLKRSVSDVLNSNELPALVMSVMQEKRQKALSGEKMALCMQSAGTDANNGKLVVNTDKEAAPAPPLTEAQRNKLKVLSQEYDSFRGQPASKPVPDINLNTLPDEELTDLQRNRRRMMQNDLFGEYNKAPLANRALLQLDLDTERSRNRRKVLESEFDILTGQKVSTTTFTLEDATTPMSTASDTPLTDSVSVEVLKSEAQFNDLRNGNLPAREQHHLKLDVQLANARQQSQLSLPTATDTAQVEITPECALNTAGLMAKQGFHLDDAQAKAKALQLEIILEAPLQNDSLLCEEGEEVPFAVMDYSTPYKRCVELIESNFTCPTRSPYFRLNKCPTQKANADAAKCTKESDLAQPAHKPPLNLNSMSVITLTEFLQKSIITPMKTHLEVVNNEVMRLFLEDLHILDHLRSLRHYFFLMDGEFGSIICDGIIGKLEDGAPPEKLLNYQMLHSILDTALGSSITGHDKNAENLSFIVADVPEKFDLTSPGVLSTLSLSYRVAWPLNLILNPETLEQYANLFKYLIKVRRISWLLERAYQILKEAVKKHGPNLLKAPQYRHVQQIRHKFYHFVHALQNHITANALQASWKTFKDDLLQAKSIEDIYRKHTAYVKRILFLCMLNRRSVEFYNTIENIFKITLRFYNNLKSREFKLRQNDEHFTHSRYEKLATDEQEFDKFIRYTIYLGNKIVRHGYQAEIGEFISLINYNQYYLESGI